MKRVLKRLLLCVALVLVVLLGTAVVGLLLLRSEPEFYRRRQWTPEQRSAAARHAEQQFIELQNHAARARAHESVRRRGASPATAIAGAITLRFTEDELNAFFEKWVVFQDWKSAYEPYIEAPAIALREGRIILAARVKKLGCVVSLHFEPRIVEDGMLQVRLSRILGGRLPLPTLVISESEAQIVAEMQRSLPRWRSRASMDSTGAANADTVAAAMCDLLLNIVRDRAGEPALFLPPVDGRSVPMRLSAVQVTDGAIDLTIEPFTREERAAILARIKSGDATASTDR
ncbi:MAG: hypothetical protein ACREJC_11345 [Tepidisphaeraceae bacterium]